MNDTSFLEVSEEQRYNLTYQLTGIQIRSNPGSAKALVDPIQNG